jgi:hypothetical protein
MDRPQCFYPKLKNYCSSNGTFEIQRKFFIAIALWLVGLGGGFVSEADPVDALMRLLLVSPLGADARDLAFFPEEGPLADYCNGDRLRRIHAALPPGSVAPTCTLFFDEINRDQKGFNSGDGGIVVGGFFRSQVRESTDAKVSFCTFPKVTFGHKTVASRKQAPS